jgi:hypothetical protein
MPKCLSIKTPVCSQRLFKIVQQASKALLKDRLQFHWGNKAFQLQEIQQLENFFRTSVNEIDQQRIFTAVESSFKNIFEKQKACHIRKFLLLKKQQNRALPTPTQESENLILNHSKYVHTNVEESVLKKGLNFPVSNSHFYLDMVCPVESATSELLQNLGMELRWRIRSMPEKSKSLEPNLTGKDLKALKSLRLNKDIRILQADEGNCMVVLDETEYHS